MPRNMIAYNRSFAIRERIHALVWAAYNRDENPYRADMAAQLGFPESTINYNVAILNREGRYPRFAPKTRIPVATIAARFATLDRIKTFLASCNDRGHLATNQDVADYLRINRSTANHYIRHLRARGDCPPINTRRGPKVGKHYVEQEIPVEDVEAMKRQILRERGVMNA